MTPISGSVHVLFLVFRTLNSLNTLLINSLTQFLSQFKYQNLRQTFPNYLSRSKRGLSGNKQQTQKHKRAFNKRIFYRVMDDVMDPEEWCCTGTSKT